jgi:hypothetical protein
MISKPIRASQPAPLSGYPENWQLHAVLQLQASI